MGRTKTRKDIPMWAKLGHKKPTTRREFLAHGLIPFAAYAVGPNLLGMLLSPQAHAAPNCPSEGGGMIPFITLNLSGGAAMGGNYVPMNAAGTPIASYSKMGLGDNLVPIEREFGGVPFAGAVGGVLISKMLEGIRASASAATLANTAFVAVCVRSRDDSRENPFDISAFASKAGVVGNLLSNMGTQSTNTGINQAAALTPPPPLIVRGFQSVANSLGYSAALGSQLNTAQKQKLSSFIRKLASSQAAKLASIQSGAKVQTLVECAGIKNETVLNLGAAGVDPGANAGVASVWGITQGANTTSQSYIFSSMTYNAILGQAGTVSLEMGGYDYHDNTRTSGDGRDRAAGVVMGQILETARVLNKPVFLYVTSDGAVSSVESTARNSPWNSDRGTAGVAYMIAYNPSGRPATSGFQVGQFTDGQVADDKFITGNDPALAAQAVFANYLKLNKKLNLFNSVIPKGALDAGSLDKVIKFG